MKLIKKIAVLLMAAMLLGMLPAATAEVVSNVQNAINATELLTTHSYAVIPGKGLVSVSPAYEDFLSIYARLDVKKLIVSRSTFEVYALTNSGDLYFRHGKIASDVRDMVFATTNVNEEGWFLTNDGRVFTVYVPFDETTPTTYEISSGMDITAMAVDKHDLFVALSDGTITANCTMEDWAKCDFSDWREHIAVLGVAKVMDKEGNGIAEYATVAAITADGRTLATGDFADEIISWGPLSYITMCNDVIIGLLPDGTLRATGVNGQRLYDEASLGNLTNIAGVKVGGEYFSAIDNNGNYYFCKFDFDTYGVGNGLVVSASGAVYANGYDIYLYAADGNAYMSTDDNPAWADENGALIPEVIEAAPLVSGGLPDDCTEDDVEAYIAGLFTDIQPQLDEQQWEFDCIFYVKGQSGQILIRTPLSESEVDADLLHTIAIRIAESEIINASPASVAPLYSWEGNHRNAQFEIEGWEISYGELPFGGMVLNILRD